MLGLIAAAQAEAQESLEGALRAGRPLLDARLRWEEVEQEGFGSDAEALTLRLRLGYVTGRFHGFRALLESEHVFQLVEHYNDTTNDRLHYPLIADPEADEINRASLTYDGIAGLEVIAGRQRIILDNARFIGNVGWRQNEQTFDALRATWAALPDVVLDYSYLGHAHRVFGNDAPQGDYDTDAHLLHLSYAAQPAAKLSAYAYLIEIDEDEALSSASYGLRLAGDVALAAVPEIALSYAAEYAYQTDHGNNPASYDVSYYLLSAGLGAFGLSGALAYEVLGGTGSEAFQTPLATLHVFQGWADVFLTTPPEGIEDLALEAKYVRALPAPFGGLVLNLVYHDFEAEEGGRDFGEEWDVAAGLKLSERVALLAKYADYEGGPFADREKFWLQAEITY